MIDKSRLPRDIANAFILLSKANHYMLKFNAIVTLDDLEKARQILIIWSNDANNQNKDIELALDLINEEIKGYRI